MEIRLNKINKEKIDKVFKKNFFIVLIILFLAQFLFLYFVNINRTPQQKLLIMAISSTFTLIYYISIYHFTIKLFFKNKISAMFFQSCFLNIGIFFSLTSFPFFIIAYFRYEKLIYYFITSIIIYFVISLIFSISIDVNKVTENSLKNEPKGNSIFFDKTSVPKFLGKIGITYLPIIIIVYHLLMGTFLRGSADSMLYHLTVMVLTACPFFLYSEFCYVSLWIKYTFQQEKKIV